MAELDKMDVDKEELPLLQSHSEIMVVQLSSKDTFDPVRFPVRVDMRIAEGGEASVYQYVSIWSSLDTKANSVFSKTSLFLSDDAGEKIFSWSIFDSFIFSLGSQCRADTGGLNTKVALRCSEVRHPTGYLSVAYLSAAYQRMHFGGLIYEGKIMAPHLLGTLAYTQHHPQYSFIVRSNFWVSQA
jgi:hypothetical protein